MPLEGLRARVEGGETHVECSFTPDSFTLEVRGYKAGAVLRLAPRRLLGEIVPDESRFKVLANKVIVTLYKATEGPLAKAQWRTLT